MGEKTKIQWTEATWNPVRGCSRVSKGCEHCYAEGVARRFAGWGQPYEGLVRLDGSGKPKAQWNGTVRMVREHLTDPLRWERPRLVFVNSMSDLFHERLSDRDIAEVFAVMALAEKHAFQTLTKRAERMCALLQLRSFWEMVMAEAEVLVRTHPTPNAPSSSGAWAGFEAWAQLVVERRRLPNVWIGVSIEDQSTADERLTQLSQTPAELRWASYEPALAAVDLTAVVPPESAHQTLDALNGRVTNSYDDTVVSVPTLDWVVIGGESGFGARPFHLEWARAVILACKEAGVAVFVKQLGSQPRVERLRPLGVRHAKGGTMEEWPADLRVREWPVRA